MRLDLGFRSDVGSYQNGVWGAMPLALAMGM